MKINHNRIAMQQRHSNYWGLGFVRVRDGPSNEDANVFGACGFATAIDAFKINM